MQASALTTYGKCTLPSVEGWGTNMNIIRDPPKSIHTRRIDKVDNNNKITDMISESHDRISENINVYSTGVNPMASVSYQTYGSGASFGKLPRRIMRDGAFRFPTKTMEELRPLSRQHRVLTKVETNPGVVNNTKRLKNCVTVKNAKEVRNAILKASVRPTSVYKKETFQGPTYDVKNNIIDIKPKISMSASVKPLGVKKINIENVPGIRDDKLNVFASSNNKGKTKKTDITINTDSYIQNDPLAYSSYSNPGSNKYNNENRSNIVVDDYTQDANLITYNPPVSLNKQTEYLNTDVILQPKLLDTYEFHANKSNTKVHKIVPSENEVKTNCSILQTLIKPNMRNIKNTGHMTTTTNLKPKIYTISEFHLRPAGKPTQNTNPTINLGYKNISK